MEIIKFENIWLVKDLTRLTFLFIIHDAQELKVEPTTR